MSKKLVEKDTYVQFLYEESQGIITAVWPPTTEDLYDDEEYKQSCLLTAKVCETYQPKYWLVDNRTLFYTIPPDIQE